SAHTAASREEPQPKFSAATTICAPRNPGWLRTNSGFSEPSALKRTSWKRKLAYSGTLRSLRRKRAGMTRSVSMFGRSIGTATAVTRVKACTLHPECANVGEPAGHRRRGRHGRGHQVRARALALAPLEVPVRCGGHPLALAGQIAVHPHAHRAAGVAPLESSLDEDAVEPLGLRGALDEPGAGHDRRRHHGAAPLHHTRRRAQV